MKKFINILKSDFSRGVFCKRFIIAVIGMILAIVFASWKSLFLNDDQRIQGLSPGYFLGFVNMALQSEGVLFVLPVLSTLPFAAHFMEEFRTWFSNFLLIRSKKKQYILSKIIVNGICGGLCISIGTLLVIGVCAIFYLPMELDQGGYSLSLFFNTTLLLILKISLMGMFWASLGTLLGIMNKSIYMVYGGPFLVNYMLVILVTRYFTSAHILNPREWLMQQHMWRDNGALMCAFLFGICVVVILLEGVSIRWKLERK